MAETVPTPNYHFPEIPYLEQPPANYPFGDYVEPPLENEHIAGRFTEATSGNRVNVVDFIPAPGKCAICGYSGGEDGVNPDYKRRFVDFGLDINYYGVVGFCETCVAGIAAVVGFIPRKGYDELQQAFAVQSQKVVELGLANSKLRDVVNLLSSPDNTPHFLVSNEQQDDEVRDSEIAEPEQSDDESIDEQGTNDVPSPSSDDTGPALSI